MPDPAADARGAPNAALGAPGAAGAAVAAVGAVIAAGHWHDMVPKAECLIALDEAASRKAMKVLRDSIDPQHEWQTQVERAVAGQPGNR